MVFHNISSILHYLSRQYPDDWFGNLNIFWNFFPFHNDEKMFLFLRTTSYLDTFFKETKNTHLRKCRCELNFHFFNNIRNIRIILFFYIKRIIIWVFYCFSLRHLLYFIVICSQYFGILDICMLKICFPRFLINPSIAICNKVICLFIFVLSK